MIKVVAYGVVLAAATGGSGLLFGMLSQRWGAPQELAARGKQIASLPAKVPGWEMSGEDQLEKNAQNILRAAGWYIRKYHRVGSKETATAALVLGPSGPISLHDPDVCYQGAGYRPVAPPIRTPFPLTAKTRPIRRETAVG